MNQRLLKILFFFFLFFLPILTIFANKHVFTTNIDKSYFSQVGENFIFSYDKSIVAKKDEVLDILSNRCILLLGGIVKCYMLDILGGKLDDIIQTQGELINIGKEKAFKKIYKDDNNIYDFGSDKKVIFSASGSEIQSGMSDVDYILTNNIQEFKFIGDYYATDGYKVWKDELNQITEIQGADPKTFQISQELLFHEQEAYTYDKSRVYYFGKVIPDADPETFGVYGILEDLEIDPFRTYSYRKGYSYDKNNVYLWTYKLPGISPSDFDLRSFILKTDEVDKNFGKILSQEEDGNLDISEFLEYSAKEYNKIHKNNENHIIENGKDTDDINIFTSNIIDKTYIYVLLFLIGLGVSVKYVFFRRNKKSRS